MEITCDECHVKLKVPDEKIPKENSVKINCPKCKSGIVIGQKKKKLSKKSTQTESQTKDDQEKNDIPETLPADSSGDDIDLQFFLDDSKVALIMTNNDDDGEKIKNAVKELGYKFIKAVDTRDALKKMKAHLYDLFILTDGFDSNDFSANPVLNYLNNISMSERRRMFLALIGHQFKSMDEATSFAMSADVVINSNDHDNLFSILKKSVTEKERFYSIFMEILMDSGRW